MKSSLTTFINDELLPKVIDNMDTVFPERKWTKKGYRWNSPYHTDGSESKSGKSVRSFLDTSKNHLNRVGESDGGGTVGLVGYAMMYKGYSPDAKGEPFISTIKYLCEKVGIEFPSHNSEEYEKYLTHQKKIEALYEEMRQALYTEEGRSTLEYLTNVRGYSLDEIKEMGFGHITREMADRINRERLPLSYNPTSNPNIESGEQKSIPYGVGITHTLVVPYVSNNTIKGFKFRHLKKVLIKDNKEISKYYNNTGLPKGTSLFGFHGLQMTGNREKDRDLTIVEGELDCLHAQVMGMKNIVAVAGSSLDVAALQKVKAKGVVRITLLFDTEETPEKQKENYRKVENAIKVIREIGITTFVASLPSDGGKMDVDDYLKTHSVEDLYSVVDNAIPASIFLFRQIASWATEHANEDGSITYKNLDEFKRQTIKLAVDDNTSFAERDMILREFSEMTNSVIRYETLKEESKVIYEEEKGRQNQDICEKELSSLLSKVKKEGWNTVLTSLEETSRNLTDKIKMISQTSILDDDSDEIFESFKKPDKSINTNIELFDGFNNSYRFTMPAGGITVIAAPTGHGKSKVLQNIALDVVQNQEDGIVLYITYEESVQSITKGMINVFANLELTRKTAKSGNLQTITRYLSNGSTQYMKSEMIEPFRCKVAAFRKLLKDRKLKIHRPESNSLEELLDTLKKALSQTAIPIKGIFIDYVQEIYLGNTKYSRSDELKEVMLSIDLVAQKYNIPIIVAAQLNRDTVDSPLSLCNQAIADSAWIERKATEILQIYSNKEKCKKDPDGRKTENANKTIPNLNLGTGGKLYFLLTKSRNAGNTGQSVILDINGNTGKITGNYKEESYQTEIDFEEEDPF